jgi:hypothetical protein
MMQTLKEKVKSKIATFGILLLSLALSGCAGLGKTEGTDPEKWKLRRDGWVEKILSNPGGSEKEVIKLVNFSSSVHVDGEENLIHGESLVRVKQAVGEKWGDYLKKARTEGAESSSVLIEAYERGQGFTHSPSGVIFSLRDEHGLSSRTVSLDLGQW